MKIFRKKPGTKRKKPARKKLPPTVLLHSVREALIQKAESNFQHFKDRAKEAKGNGQERLALHLAAKAEYWHRELTSLRRQKFK